MNVSLNDLNMHEAGEYLFRDGTIEVTFVEIAIWKQNPNAHFRLMRKHPIQAVPRYVLGPQLDSVTLSSEQLFYKSSNGDSWSLTHDPQTSVPWVIHRPNLPSGGIPSSRQIGEFLAEPANGPEHQALRSLLNTGPDTRTILIGYDIHPRFGQVSEAIINSIKSFGTWWHHLETVWIVRSTKTPPEIRDVLGPLLGFDDQLLVVDVTGDAAGWAGINEAGTEWLNQNM